MPSAPSLVGPLIAYTAARLAIVGVIAGLLVVAGVPLLLALLIGLIAALPLSMVLLRGLRGRLDTSLAVVRERRAAQREVLRSRLRGDDADPAGELRADPAADFRGGPGDPSGDAAERKADAHEDRPAQQQ
ncbi:MAG TPA: DUF4229 domain-containing protein [Pseudonocardia sp.]